MQEENVIIQHPQKTDEIRTESLLAGRFQKFSEVLNRYKKIIKQKRQLLKPPENLLYLSLQMILPLSRS